jgi:hypothetical protein
MAARLNVTEAERLMFSRKKLQAISALRNAGLSAEGVMQNKERLPDKSGRFYRLIGPDGSVVWFSTLRHIVAYADDYRTYIATMLLLEADECISWQQWRRDGTAYALALLVPQLRAMARRAPKAPPASLIPPGALCSDPQCSYPASGLIDGSVYCAGHILVYSTLATIQQTKGSIA